MSSFELVPFGANAPRGAAACDGLVDGAEIDLSHWPNNKTPAAYKADTSTEIALRFVQAGGRPPKLVVNNHFDVDGVLSVFALLRPDVAAAHEAVLVAAAEHGDFDAWPVDERGLKLACAIDALAEGKEDADAYTDVLRALPSLLAKLRQREDLWGAAYRALTTALEGAERGEVSIERIGPIAVVVHRRGTQELPGAVVDKLMPPRSQRVLWAFEEGSGAFAYRYELPRWAWADTVVRPRLEAPGKNALAAKLGGAWALKGGGLGMTGLIKTKAPIAEPPVRVAARLLEREQELGTLPASGAVGL